MTDQESPPIRAMMFDQGGTPTIACINMATVNLGVPFDKLVQTLRLFNDEFFSPIWGTPCKLVGAANLQAAPPKSWQMLFIDDPDEADALGYHDLSKDGQPVSKIFVKTTLEAGEKVSVTACHELCEMLIDPGCQLWADNGKGKFYAYEMCFTGDTLISLLDGTEVAIADLVDRKEFWVYSATANGSIVPGRGHGAHKTGIDMPVVEVTLDDGSSFKCTRNHRVMTRNGDYCEAGSLKSGDSLMPLYRRRAPIDRKDGLDYEQVLDQESGEWLFTHRVVAPDCPSGSVRHHINFNRFDNSPTNFEIMTWHEHRKLHQSAIEHARKSPKFKAVQRAKMLKIAEERRGKPRPAHWKPAGFIALNSNPAHIARATKQLDVVRPKANTPEQRRKAALNGKHAFDNLWTDPDFRAHHSARGAALMRAYNGSEEQRLGLAAYNHRRWHANRHILKDGCQFCAQPSNHKVVSVHDCGSADVYDFTVDEHHNFALSAGVFVHNCDAVEEATFMLDGVEMSDFVHPAYFESFRKKGSSKFDHLGLIRAPFTMLKGGYSIIRQGGRTTNIFGSAAKRKRFMREDRRMHRSEYRLGRAK